VANSSTATALGPEDTILENALAPLSRYYRRDNVEEIFVNQVGEVIIKTGPFQWEAIRDPALSEKNLLRLLSVLASRTKRIFGPRHPILYTETKPEGYRLTAITDHVIYNHADTTGLAICVRKTRTKARSISDFLIRAPAQAGTPQAKDMAIADLAGSTSVTVRARHSDDVADDLIKALDKGGGILVSGGMGTGKSNLMMALIEMIPADRRIITIEDAKELVVPNHNRLHIIVDREENSPDSFTWSKGVDFLRRATPDVILPGEVSNANAAALLALMNSGMANFMTTIHASSPEGAFRAMAVNVAARYQGGGALNDKAILEIMRFSIARVVQIEIDATGRRLIVDSKTPEDLNLFTNSADRNDLLEQIAAVQKRGATQAEHGPKDQP